MIPTRIVLLSFVCLFASSPSSSSSFFLFLESDDDLSLSLLLTTICYVSIFFVVIHLLSSNANISDSFLFIHMRNADGWLCLALSHTRERKSISRSLTLVFVYTCREIVRFDHRGDRMRRFLFLLSLVYLSRERMKERKKKRNHVTYFQAKAGFFFFFFFSSQYSTFSLSRVLCRYFARWQE